MASHEPADIPCPNCGSSAVHENPRNDRISCESCGYEGPRSGHPERSEEDDEFSLEDALIDE